ncbi:MAG: HAMP domain-containing histidine kinase [Spirochaetes bacterium]|nr:HAMP domain-containing histidine kinase [Spirochaetota bacterium]
MKIRSSLSIQIFGAALLILTLLTFAGGFFISIVEKQNEFTKAQQESLLLKDQLVSLLQEAVWNFAYSQAETMLVVAMRDERLSYARIWNSDGTLFSGFSRAEDGEPVSVQPNTVYADASDQVIYAELNYANTLLGMLELGFVYDSVIRNINRELLAFSLRSVFIVLAGLLILVIYVKLVIIDAIANLNNAISRIGHKDFTVRVGKEIRRQDEIGSLARNLNRMVETIQEYSAGLEGMVAERTSRLVESEKLAFLGSLTSGVAHEINTPVGVGVTAASHMQELIRNVRDQLAAGQLTRSAMDNFFEEADETANILLMNLQRASNFVTSFKKITADQSNEDLRLVNLNAYIGEILFSLRPRLKNTPHTINLNIPESISWYGYPGMLSQIVSNLLMNTLAHAYPDKRAGSIELSADVQNDDILLLYSDDGSGIGPDNMARIFQPFFTTRREQGGTGLGLYIVYNIVSKLGGSIKCESKPGEGVRFIMTLPQQTMPQHKDV